MGRKKGGKNILKIAKKSIDIKRFKHKQSKKRYSLMKNLQDVLDATTALSTALDTLITGIGNIKSIDMTPAVDAINAVTMKIQVIQLPTA